LAAELLEHPPTAQAVIRASVTTKDGSLCIVLFLGSGI
jgi:hypothetical protein